MIKTSCRKNSRSKNKPVSEKLCNGSTTKRCSIDIVGANLEEVKEIGKKVLDGISQYPGAVDVKSTLDPGSTEARVVLNRE